MAWVENIPPINGDSEMEEGEIVDDVDDLSDISSEEEFLLRQRLQVLENYNNVLERKKAKRSFSGSGKQRNLLNDLSEISATDLDDSFTHSVPIHRNESTVQKHKTYHKHKKRDESKPHISRSKETHKKKTHRKKRIEVKVISESSEESDDEYRNKRRKLADAVIVCKPKHNDQSSLQDRIKKMLHGNKVQQPEKTATTVDKETETNIYPVVQDVSCSPIVDPNKNNLIKSPNTTKKELCTSEKKTDDKAVNTDESKDSNILEKPECIILSTDDDDGDNLNKSEPHEESQDVVDSVKMEEKNTETINEEKHSETNNKEKASDSDEDLELLRQHALKTKASKTKTAEINVETEKPLSEDEDSDTAELRIICLKSALLKKAIEMKQKQKLQKRLSQSSNLQDDLLSEQMELMNKIESENNTDIESVDMEIGSDGDDKQKDTINEKISNNDQGFIVNDLVDKDRGLKNNVEDELDEDEDLLRARLLTSLSKNLPNLVDPVIINSMDEREDKTVEKSTTTKPQIKVPENRIVINLGESDSEGEHEATKNLTKMHIKLSEQIDFQEKLDMFLKSTRMEVEKSKLPDVVQEPALPKTPQKYVAKAVNHLPKSEQIEYKNLVKRMAELEKIKEARQSSMNLANKNQSKDTLKSRNVTIDPTKTVTINNKLEEQIAMSRKSIAEESAKMLKLKEEATKLSQKYKIVATELKNISTAITLNKKEQRTVQSRLSRIRAEHLRLLSTTSKHSKGNGQLVSQSRPVNRPVPITKKNDNVVSKEPPKTLPSIKIDVTNDLKEETVANRRLTVQLDVSSNTKSVKVPIGDSQKATVALADTVKENEVKLQVEETERCREESLNQKCERRQGVDDYESPLQALDKATWEADPNAILCPFEVGGHCKDPDCKYFHPKAPTL